MLQITSCQEIIKIYNFYFIFVKYEICGLKNVLLPRCHYKKKENFGDSHFHNILSLLMFYQIFLSPQVQRSAII